MMSEASPSDVAGDGYIQVEGKGISTRSLSYHAAQGRPNPGNDKSEKSEQKLPEERETSKEPEITTEESGDSTNKESDSKACSFRQLWRYSTGNDLILLVIGVVACVGEGAGMPMWTVLFGEALNAFDESQRDSLTDEIRDIALVLVYIGIGVAVCAMTGSICLNTVAARVAVRVRDEYVQAVLRNDMEWHDRHTAAGLKIRLDANVPKMQAALGSKLKFGCTNAAMGVIGLIVAFYYSWKLTLVFLVASPIEMVGFAMLATMMMGLEKTNSKMYEAAGALADEVLTLIRTVTMYGTQNVEQRRYRELVHVTKDKGTRFGLQFAFASALPDTSEFLLYALGFYYGNQLVREGNIEAGDILIALYCTLVGVMGLASLGDAVTALFTGKVAAGALYAVIDYEPSINATSPDGVTPTQPPEGVVSVRGLHFSYPSNPDLPVLQGINLDVKRGEVLAIVGHSGCGKSTITSLMLRFYDPQKGSVLLDGRPLHEYNVEHLRRSIGLVQQQPILLPGTIFENIALGKQGATVKEVEDVAKTANAHDFITSFPDGYQTDIGGLGSNLSGGQRQRIAIARTLIAKPTVLLLDEATSALDSRSEARFQNLLDSTKNERATIIIAHRLSTVRNADRIVVMDAGKVVEQGTHDELMAVDGMYREMINERTKVAGDDAAPRQGSRSDSATDDDDVLDAVAATSRASQLAKPAKASDAASSDRKLESVASLASDSAATKKKQKAARAWAWSHARASKGLLLLAVFGGLGSGLGWPATTYLLGESLQLATGFFEQKDFACQGPLSGLNFSSLDDCEGECASDDVVCWGCQPLTFLGSAGNTTLIAEECADRVACGGVGCVSAFVEKGDKGRSNDISLAFLIVALITFLFQFLRAYTSYRAGENLTLAVRMEYFGAYINKGAAWHDRHATADLTTQLATGAAEARKLFGDAWPVYAHLTSLLIGGLAMAFASCWRMALVMVFVIPIVGASAAVGMAQAVNIDASSGVKEFQVISKQAETMLSNIRLISSLGQNIHYHAKYAASLADVRSYYKRKGAGEARGQFLMQSTTFFAFALAFWYGGETVDRDQCSFVDMNKALLGVLFCGYMAGMNSRFIPDVAKAILSVTEGHQILSDADTDASKHQGQPIQITQGRVEFRHVRFAYPSRPDAPILLDVNLVVEPGETVAVVGGSGCGKSTLITLLQKLYHPDSGQILVDGVDISTVDSKSLREQIGVVEQEPKLFDRTIFDNITYRPQAAPIVEGDVDTVARMAQAYDFIQDKDEKYMYKVGRFGDRLSGGQKQRVAISRALFGARGVKILLLDEATSALDTVNEARVQRALDAAQAGKTAIIVAHRLSTIENADKIVVLSEGRVAESGTFHTLLDDPNSLFSKFYREQI
eukprot:m.968231 g.968231  ORF g.968231 m.968231 type:complete len:1382 (+) comp23916_c0_seq1:200-4345(+)